MASKMDVTENAFSLLFICYNITHRNVLFKFHNADVDVVEKLPKDTDQH